MFAERSGVYLKKTPLRKIMNAGRLWGLAAQQAQCLLAIKRGLLVSGLIMSCPVFRVKVGDSNSTICDVWTELG